MIAALCGRFSGSSGTGADGTNCQNHKEPTTLTWMMIRYGMAAALGRATAAGDRCFGGAVTLI